MERGIQGNCGQHTKSVKNRLITVLQMSLTKKEEAEK